MSGVWPQHPGGYPSQGAYPQPGPYPQPDGYHQGGYYPQEGYPPHAAYHPQPGFPPHGAYQEGHVHGQYGQYPQYPVQNYPQYPPQYGPPQGQYPYPQQIAPYAQPAAYPPVAQASHSYPPTQHVPPTHRPPLNTCYNCGAPDHWAQHCPEPKREVPHGQLLEGATRPAKRFRPNYIPPVVTKYPIPQHVAHQQPTPPSFTPSPNWTQPPITTPGSNGMRTPVSHGNGQNNKQELSPVQKTASGAAPPSPATSLQPVKSAPANSPGKEDGVGTPPEIGGNQLQATAAPNEAGEHKEAVPMSRQASTNTSVSMESESDTEGDTEDYLLLDIPDLPSRINYPDSKRPRLIETPFPPLCEGDVRVTYVTPEAGNSCTIKSLYHHDGNDSVLETNIRESDDFPTLSSDPIFMGALLAQTKARSPGPSFPRPAKREVDNSSVNDSSQRQDVDRMPDQSHDDPSPSSTDLQRLIRKYYPDAAPQKLSRNAPPPPPPPPPHRHGPHSNLDGASQSPPRGYRRQSSYSAHSPAYRVSHERSPVSGSSRKREREEDGPHRPDGERQHDEFAPKPRRNAPKVADVYSRRW